MPRKTPRILLALLLLLLPFPSRANEQLARIPEPSPDYVIKNFDMHDGLPSDEVLALLQTRDGYLWVATFNGLARFDGVRFQVYNSINTPALPNNQISCLFEDREGRLWIGSYTGEISWLDRDGFHKAVLQHGYPNSPIAEMVQANDGTIWFKSRDSRLAYADISPTNVAVRSSSKIKGLFSGMIKLNDGSVWLNRIDGRIGQLKNGAVTFPTELPHSIPGQYRRIVPAREGGFWIRDGTRVVRWQNRHQVEERRVPNSVPIGKFVVIFEDSTGGLWFGTGISGAVCVRKDGSDRILGPGAGLQHAEVTAVIEDSENDIWIGTEGGGLAMLRPRAVTMINPKDHWKFQSVVSVSLAKDGGLWIGAAAAGVYHYHWQDDTFTRLSPEGELADKRVRSVLQDRSGELWIGGELPGNWQDGQFIKSEELAELHAPVYAIMQDSSGALWFGSQRGIMRYKDSKWEELGLALRKPSVRCFAQEPGGAIWLGMMGGGIARYAGGKFTQYLRADGLPSDNVTSVFAQTNGDLWIGTAGAGLTRWRNGQFVTFTTRNGLPSDFICHICSDDNGNLWIASYGGIFRVAATELDLVARKQIEQVRCVVLDGSDGLASLDIRPGNQPNACQTPDGRLWFGTSKGLAMVNPAAIHINRTPPPVKIEEVVVDGQSLLSNRNQAASTNPATGEMINIPAGSTQIEFKYTALNLRSPQRVRFKHRLFGPDNVGASSWVESKNNRSVSFLRLEPGEYKFQVIACNDFGYWNETGARLKFRVLPFFWQTRWFSAGCWLGAVSLVGVAVIVLTRRRYRRKMETLERSRALETERARIAQDLHDDLGAGLTEITTTCTLAQDESVQKDEVQGYVREIGERADQMVLALDEIVWAVSPKHDNSQSVASYICHYAGQFLKTTNLRCRLMVPPNLPSAPLNTQQRYNLLLAVKEALNNAVKHSGGTELRLSISMPGSLLCIQIDDNGHGFTEGDAAPGAIGLQNMRKRLSQMGGSTSISQLPEGGTRVEFRLPLNIPNFKTQDAAATAN